MFNPWVLLAVGVAFVANGFYWDYHGHTAADTEWTARIQTERAEAAKSALTAERAAQKGVNDALRTQNETLGRVAARLRHDLDGLRDRPERPANLSETPRTDCQDANGAELAGSHAAFLARYAAAAAEQDAALSACYLAFDAIK